MDKIPENPEIEERIAYEIVVDAYDEYERAVGWRCYLDDNLHFPFKAECIAERQVSPLEKGEKIEVAGMIDDGDELGEMFVEIKWKGRKLGVPLAQISPIKTDEETEHAIEAWHYWTARAIAFRSIYDNNNRTKTRNRKAFGGTGATEQFKNRNLSRSIYRGET